MCTKVRIADLLAALREIPKAFPGCQARTGASNASRGQVVGYVGQQSTKMQTASGLCWAAEYQNANSKGLPDRMIIDCKSADNMIEGSAYFFKKHSWLLSVYENTASQLTSIS